MLEGLKLQVAQFQLGTEECLPTHVGRRYRRIKSVIRLERRHKLQCSAQIESLAVTPVTHEGFLEKSGPALAGPPKTPRIGGRYMYNPSRLNALSQFQSWRGPVAPTINMASEMATHCKAQVCVVNRVRSGTTPQPEMRSRRMSAQSGRRPRGTCHFERHRTCLCKKCAVPEGTRGLFPVYPALRLRLRAGLNSFALRAGFSLAKFHWQITTLLVTQTLHGFV